MMIEAMACGTPVIAHRRGSVEEVVDQGVTGFHSISIDGLAEMVEPLCGSTGAKFAITRFADLAIGPWSIATSISTVHSQSREFLARKRVRARPAVEPRPGLFRDVGVDVVRLFAEAARSQNAVVDPLVDARHAQVVGAAGGEKHATAATDPLRLLSQFHVPPIGVGPLQSMPARYCCMPAGITPGPALGGEELCSAAYMSKPSTAARRSVMKRVSCANFRERMNDGMAIKAMSRMMATTIMISSRLKPEFLFIAEVVMGKLPVKKSRRWAAAALRRNFPAIPRWELGSALRV